MRTIKFRGKRVDKDELVFGDLLTGMGYKKGKFYILPHLTHYPSDCNSLDGYEVETGTVGQFTGLYDKDGKEIYEGDIIKYTHEICIEDGPGTYVGAVSFCEGMFCLHEDSDCTVATAIYESEEYGGICVIGNIHDNPELLTNK